MGRVALASVTCPAPPHFTTLSPNVAIFRKKKVLNIKFLFLYYLQYMSETFLILRRIHLHITINGRSQWPRGLRRRSTASRLLRFWVRIPPVSWMSVCCDCCVLSGRGLCDALITRPEESYRL